LKLHKEEERSRAGERSYVVSTVRTRTPKVEVDDSLLRSLPAGVTVEEIAACSDAELLLVEKYIDDVFPPAH
jgi:hypothetical protein